MSRKENTEANNARFDWIVLCAIGRAIDIIDDWISNECIGSVHGLTRDFEWELIIFFCRSLFVRITYSKDRI
jgi:hypothetical protein